MFGQMLRGTHWDIVSSSGARASRQSLPKRVHEYAGTERKIDEIERWCGGKGAWES